MPAVKVNNRAIPQRAISAEVIQALKVVVDMHNKARKPLPTAMQGDVLEDVLDLDDNNPSKVAVLSKLRAKGINTAINNSSIMDAIDSYSPVDYEEDLVNDDNSTLTDDI